jgi:hypothetical protein
MIAYTVISFGRAKDTYYIYYPAYCGGDMEVVGNLKNDDTIKTNVLLFSNGVAITAGISYTVNTAATAVIHTDSTNALSKLANLNQFVVVTSAASGYIISLPVTSSATVGTIINGFVGANGCMLRLAAADQTAGTKYLNNVNAVKQATIPANSLFRVTCVSATQWVLTATSYAGAAVATITPGALGY